MQLAGRILKWLGIGLLGLTAFGLAYQQIGLMLDARLAPPASEMVTVNGHAVHIECRGKGATTYLLDAGAGAFYFEWWRLQPLLAKTARVCAFDRAGLGWSTPSSGPHDAATAADELSQLVKAAAIPTPFVYVGHSLGANFATVYYAKYPHDVSGLVLIEPGDPKDLLEDFHGTRAEAFVAPDCDLKCYAAQTATYFGITRAAAHLLIKDGRNLAGPMLDQYRAGLGRPSAVGTFAASLAALPRTAYEDMDVRSFGDVPVLVLASSDLREPEGDETVADVKKWRVRQLAFLASLAAKSSRGKGPIVVPASSHSSMVMGIQQSQFLANTISAFIDSTN